MKDKDIPKPGQIWRYKGNHGIREIIEVEIIGATTKRDSLGAYGLSGHVTYSTGLNCYHVSLYNFLEQFEKKEGETMQEFRFKREIQFTKGQNEVTQAANSLTDFCHGIAKECGWWENTTERDVPRLLMLCVSELAEAMEGDRKGLKDDHLPARDMLEVELADCLIRIFDMAGGLGLDVAGAIAEKLEYNTKRADHKPENRDQENGKKY